MEPTKYSALVVGNAKLHCKAGQYTSLAEIVRDSVTHLIRITSISAARARATRKVDMLMLNSVIRWGRLRGLSGFNVPADRSD